jgi:type II secretory pathway pseudopilin PulG
LVEVVVASGLMGVALVVLLSNLSAVVSGGRVEERRTVEERLARNQMEVLRQETVASSCAPASSTQLVDSIKYTVTTPACGRYGHYVEYTVKVDDGSAATTLVDDRWIP